MNALTHEEMRRNLAGLIDRASPSAVHLMQPLYRYIDQAEQTERERDELKAFIQKYGPKILDVLGEPDPGCGAYRSLEKLISKYAAKAVEEAIK